jgi:hypothetical protein
MAQRVLSCLCRQMTTNNKPDMKKTALTTSAALLIAAYVPALAGSPAPAVMAAPPEAPFVTGFLSLAYETHFISYGSDVWGGGDEWEDGLFHPTLEIDFNLGGGWQAYLNTWWDVNDLSATPSDIGGNVQEVDVNVGFYYTMDKWKFQLGYGAWMYASEVEHILDAKVSYNDGMWNPFLMLHGRLDDFPFDAGLVAQVGIAPSKTFGKVAVTVPVTVSFDTDGFHGGDAGFAYVSAGVGVAIPLCKHTTLNLGATYYHTNDDVIPFNVDDDFVVGSGGITIAW